VRVAQRAHAGRPCKADAIALLLLSNHQDLNRRESSVLLVPFGLVMYLRLAVVS